MKYFKIEYVFFLVIFFTAIIAGCANIVKFQFESSPTDTAKNGPQMTIAKLADDWTNYHIYYSGLRPTFANGILFDPKNDDKFLKPEGVNWVKVEDEKTFRELIHWQAGPLEFKGRLLRIISPDDQFFGYIYLTKKYYSPWGKVIDKNTIVVYPISTLRNITILSYN